MRKLIYAFVYLTLFALTSNTAFASDVYITSVQSKELNREFRYSVYLPDGYKTSKLRYPVIYLLHGGNNDESSWPGKGKIQTILDRMIKNQEIPPIIAVMPGNFRSYWVDGHRGKAESAVLKDLMPDAEKKFRIIPERGARLIGGLSAGGFGSANIALKYPELFLGAIPLSPAIWAPEPSANAGARKYKQFMLDGKFDPVMWKKRNWPAHIDSYKKKKIKVRMFIVSGDHDRLDIAIEAAKFFQAMRKIQPKHTELRIINGDHTWSIWQYGIAEGLKYMNLYLSRPILPANP